MKFIKKSAMLAALIGLMIASTGCGRRSNDNGQGVVPGPYGQPGYYNGAITPIPGGGAVVSFNGTAYNSGTNIVGGQVIPIPYGVSAYGSYGFHYCNIFTSGMRCYDFLMHQAYQGGGNTGQLTGGSVALPPNQAGMLTRMSQVEPNSGITVVATPGSDMLHSNISGYITLSQQWVAMHFPSGIPASTAQVAIDLQVSGGQIIYGAALFYTNTSSNPPQGGLLIL